MKEIDIIELDFLTRITKTMEARHMTASALARKANMSHSGVFRALSGTVGLSFERAYQLADALGLEFYPMLRMKEAPAAPETPKAPAPARRAAPAARRPRSRRDAEP